MTTKAIKAGKTDRTTRKLARDLEISASALSLKLKRTLRKHYIKGNSLEQKLFSRFTKSEVPNSKQLPIVEQITKLLYRISKLHWTARERVDQRRSTKRTKSINGILKTISRIEKRLQSSEFDKFPDDYAASEQGRDLKRERLRAVSALRDTLLPIKGKVGQRNELKRHLAIKLKDLFDHFEIPCKRTKSYSLFEWTFQECCKHLHLRLTDNVWHFLKRK
jgi:hypothetical protein